MDTQFCSSCGRTVSNNASQCDGCGSVVRQQCRACGGANPPGARFCCHCGVVQLVEQSSAPGATDRVTERREVTVVFVDASNFTAASHNLDTEDVYMFIDEAMRLLAEVVNDYEGTVDKFTGDGLMALFGAPVAHEDDAERAVRAAWDMQRVVKPFRDRVAAQHGFEFRVRIGVHTGEVVAGPIGGNLHTEYTVIGDTVNIASRLQAAAEPDAVYVSESTYERTAATIAYEPTKPLALKGVGTVQAYRVAGVQPATESRRGIAQRPVPMVGRDVALGELESALDGALSTRQFRLVLVTGEAGVGKTRLVQEFLRKRVISDYALLRARCVALSRSQPLSILGDLLHSLLGTHGTDKRQALIEAVETAVNRYTLSSDEIVPYAASVLGIAESDEAIERRLQQLDETMLQEQTQAAIRRLILAEAAVRPVIIFIDDLHWIDSASRDFLQYLVQSIGDVPLLLVMAARETDAHHTDPIVNEAYAATEEVKHIVLVPLTEGHAKLLLRELVPGEDAEVVAVRRAIGARAEGNPFYAEELVRMLCDSGALKYIAETAYATPNAVNVVTNLPNSLRGLILARIDTLSRSGRGILQRAAVLGRSFPAKLLQQLVPLEPAELVDELEQLVARGFLQEESFGLDRGFSFCHALLQDAVHNTLLKRDRQDLHFRAAEAICAGSFWMTPDRNEVLAHQYAESGNPALAIPYLVAAAEYSARRHANDVASDQCRRALAIAAQTPDVDRLTVFKLHLLHGHALKLLGKLGEARTTLYQAVRDLKAIAADQATGDLVLLLVNLMRELADVKLREGSLDDAFLDLQEAQLALAEWHGEAQQQIAHEISDQMARVRFRQGRLDEALSIADQLVLSLADDPTADPATLASAYNIVGGVLWQHGKLESAASYVEQSLALYRRIGYLFGKATAHRNLGVIAFARGQWREAAEHFERADWLRRETGCMLGRAANLQNLALLRTAMGDYELARRDLDRSLKISTQLGEEYDAMNTLMTLALLNLMEHRVDEAQEIIDQLGRDFVTTLREDEQARMEWLKAMLIAERQPAAAALPVAENAVRLAHAAGVPETQADCVRALGTLHARNRSDAEAEKNLVVSLEISTRMGDPYRQALALFELGCLRTRDAALRQHDIEEAARVFTRLGAAADAQRALEALEAFPRATAS